MKKLNLLTAVAIVLSAATMLYLAKATAAQESTSNVCHPGSTPNSCKVTITPSSETDGTPTIDPEDQHIFTKQNQTVEWVCPTSGCTFTVTFTQTDRPFHSRVFNKGKSKSGHITGPPNTYKYTVIVNDTQVKDPQIIVH
ncbi:MAG TPA: hypothetical protein VNM47_13230 [Terriglobia bacterium]|nr:hypothetical protein [Terriglobia bacterium]